MTPGKMGCGQKNPKPGELLRRRRVSRTRTNGLEHLGSRQREEPRWSPWFFPFNQGPRKPGFFSLLLWCLSCVSFVFKLIKFLLHFWVQNHLRRKKGKKAEV